MKGAIYWSLCLVFIPVLFLFPFAISRVGIFSISFLLVMSTLYALMTVLLELCLEFTSLNRPWRYRLAFLITGILIFLQVFLYWLLFDRNAFPTLISGLTNPLFANGIFLTIFLALLGAFTGALIVTGYKQGLQEDNAPPATLVMRVYEQHLHITGLPMVEPRGKRGFDLFLSILGLVISTPIWVTCIFLVWFEDPGPIFYIKNSIGKGGKNFRLYKFRTMALEMEKEMDLVQTQEVSAQTLFIGRFLRKTALDELPQVINIIKGEMSLVGPRPHRTPLVQVFLDRMPEFAERHRVLPGLAGLAQVAGDFYMTPRQKLRLDRLYIRHRSLGFDLKLMMLAFTITFWYRWQKDWDGRLPRSLLHLGNSTEPSP